MTDTICYDMDDAVKHLRSTSSCPAVDALVDALCRSLKFNPDMAQAIKEGRKTQTRRPIKWMDNENEPRYTHHVTMDRLFGYEGVMASCPYEKGDTHDVDGTQIKIIDIRVERLQDISEEDAIAEGVYSSRVRLQSPHVGIVGKTAIEHFKEEIWQPLPYKPPYDWNSNPWVWVIEFEKVQDV